MEYLDSELQRFQDPLKGTDTLVTGKKETQKAERAGLVKMKGGEAGLDLEKKEDNLDQNQEREEESQGQGQGREEKGLEVHQVVEEIDMILLSQPFHQQSIRLHPLLHLLPQMKAEMNLLTIRVVCFNS